MDFVPGRPPTLEMMLAAEFTIVDETPPQHQPQIKQQKETSHVAK